MELICPNCRQPINAAEINIAVDIAKCVSCNSLHKVSDLVNNKPGRIADAPPTGSKIQFRKGMLDNVEMFVPEKGMSVKDTPILIFAIFWLSFVAFWTWGASQASVLFAMFSIPFWLVGITMLVGVVNSAKETQTVQIVGDRLILIKSRPIMPKTVEFRLAEVQAVRFTNFKGNPFSMLGNMKTMNRQRYGNNVIEQPAIISGVRTEYFFENLNEVEQEWATAYLDAIVKKHK